MSLPENGRKGTPRERFRNILSAEQDDEAPPAPRKPAVVNLPRVRDGDTRAEAGIATASAPKRNAPEQATAPRLLRSFWTVGALLSIIANVVLLSMLLKGGSGGATADVLPAIYGGLEQLDNAHIRATLPVQTSLTLDTSIPVKTSTRITLRRDLIVRGAHVTIAGSGLSIDSPADIVLPAGTELDANLDMALPLQSALPMVAEVPVDISIKETELHTGIQSLKEALRPLVCANEPAAMLPDGTPICR
ncbi:MAG TPA: hypothetical protein VFH29_07170 [Anaerolineales bacterium]|nr:hypothetical protein [Anaerolineales bacterium]